MGGTYKTRRRLSKYIQIMKKELGIDYREEPSRNLMVGNAGLVTGAQYEQLAQLFTEFGSVERIILIPKKAYSFVVYSTVEEAIKALDAINGQVVSNIMDVPMYLLFVPTVPTELVPPVSHVLPEGLTLLEDFVSPEEEEKLMTCVYWDENQQTPGTGKTLKHRRVKHYGYEFRYDTNNVDKDSPLSEDVPVECAFIEARLKDFGHPLPWSPNQLTVNQYQRGQGIPSHVDTHSAFESPLLSLSLGSDVVMEFRRGSRLVPVLLPRRSLLIMDNESRYAWTHGITPRTMDVVPVAGGLTVQERGVRTSFTLRRVRQDPCQCLYPMHCDSQQTAAHPQISDQQAGHLEKLYVHDVYNNIADHFSETRTKVWPNVQEFLCSFSPGSVIVDAGCGNGKYFGVNPKVFQIGFDRSMGLAEITNSRGHEVFVCDCLQLPLQDSTADGVISVAVLHHLSTRERRLQALREMCRILTPGGRILVTVWAKNQTKQRLTAYLKQDRKNRRRNVKYENNELRPCENSCSENDEMKLRLGQMSESKAEVENTSSKLKGVNTSDFKLPVHTARTEFQYQDVFVPWKVKSKHTCGDVEEVHMRYYHVFEENELYQLCSVLPNVNILETYYTEGNWCIVFEKM